MDNVFEVPYKERGLCNCGEDLREASVLVDNGYVTGKLKGFKVCESLPIFGASKQKKRSETKRTKQKGLGF